MAQLVVSWFISEGRFRVHAINATGRQKGRIIEVESIDTGERFLARRMERLVRGLHTSVDDLGAARAWTPDTGS